MSVNGRTQHWHVLHSFLVINKHILIVRKTIGSLVWRVMKRKEPRHWLSVLEIWRDLGRSDAVCCQNRSQCCTYDQTLNVSICPGNIINTTTLLCAIESIESSLFTCTYLFVGIVICSFFWLRASFRNMRKRWDFAGPSNQCNFISVFTRDFQSWLDRAHLDLRGTCLFTQTDCVRISHTELIQDRLMESFESKSF